MRESLQKAVKRAFQYFDSKQRNFHQCSSAQSSLKRKQLPISRATRHLLSPQIRGHVISLGRELLLGPRLGVCIFQASGEPRFCKIKCVFTTGSPMPVATLVLVYLFLARAKVAIVLRSSLQSISRFRSPVHSAPLLTAALGREALKSPRATASLQSCLQPILGAGSSSGAANTETLQYRTGHIQRVRILDIDKWHGYRSLVVKCGWLGI